jgi:hypothetical protein
MNFADLLNEERLTPQEETKEIKRALTVFKGLRKGVVKIPHPRKDEVIKFRYHINDNVDGRWQVYPERNYWGLFTSNQEGEGMTVHVDNQDVFDLCTEGTDSISKNPTGIHLIEMLINNIQKKFNTFDVKIHINKPGIKFVLDEPTEEMNENMDFVDTFTEEHKKKLIKKIKTIYSVLKRGRITRSDGVSFSYELNDNLHPRVYDGEMELIASVKWIRENTYCPINERWMTELIQNRFKRFDIEATLQPPRPEDVEKYQGKKPWEKDELNEDDITEKERKRVKTIHKGIRKGIVNLNNGRYRYELPEDYKFYLIDNEIINIKFTFHNHDLGGNFGGLGLPLRVWRIEEGKDVFLNGVLTKEDVNEIVYGDEYRVNTKSGVDYVNVKSKVRNKYRNFNINPIMTSPSDNPMDLTPIINEHAGDEMIKKAKTVFKALKKGTIGPKDNPEEPRFKYELSDNITIDRNNIGIILTTDKIKIKELNGACRHNDPDYMGSLIRKRFSHFGIVLTSPYGDRYFNYDVEPWKSSMNEHAEVLNPESLTDKEIKKVKLLYKTFKEIIFTYDQLSNYGITLPENYYIYMDELGEVCIKLDKEDTEKLYMFSRIKFTSGGHLDRELEPHHDGLHRWIKERVIDKFEGFNIKFIF